MPSLDYYVALAYSNVQGINRVPPFVAGVVTTCELLEELDKRELPHKKLLLRRRHSLLDLEEAFTDVSDYLTEHEVDQIKRQAATLEDIEESYLKILRILLSKHLKVILGNIASISLRLFEDPADWKTKPFTERFMQDIKAYSNNVQTFDKDTFDRLLETAKILATVEFRRLQAVNGEYIGKVVEKCKQECIQLLKISWRSPPIEEYNNYNVGFPAVITRSVTSETVDFTYLRPKMTVSLIPLGKFCRGYQEKQRIERCKRATFSNPFGQPLHGSSGEQCWFCRNGHENTLCLTRIPLCDGFEVRCNKFDFAGSICSGLFGLYVTRFLDELKVGTSFLPNVVGRLLDQGPNTAIVFYNIEGIGAVSRLERAITKYLQENITEFSKFGVKKAYWKTPVDRRLKDFIMDWDRDDSELMNRVCSLISNAYFEIDGAQITFKENERKICRFQKNYVKPPAHLNQEYLKKAHLFKSAKGQIVGLRGSFIFLDTGYVVDVKHLQGFVLRGGFYE